MERIINLLSLFDDCAACVYDKNDGVIYGASKLFDEYFGDTKEKRISDILRGISAPESKSVVTLVIKGGEEEFTLDCHDVRLEDKECSMLRLHPHRTVFKRCNEDLMRMVFYRTFFVVYIINLKDKTMQSVYQKFQNEQYLCGEQPQPYDETIDSFADECIHPDDKNRYKQELELSNLLEKLSQNFKLSLEYRRVIAGGGYRYVVYNVQRPVDDPDTLIISVENKDDLYQEKLEGRRTRRILSAAVSNKYTTASLVNYTNNTSIMLSLKTFRQKGSSGGGSYDAILATQLERVLPDDRAKIRAMFDGAKVTEAFNSGRKSLYAEFRLLTEDEYKWVSMTVINLTEPGGDVVGLTLTEEIDDRKREEIKNSENASIMSVFYKRYMAVGFVNLTDGSLRILKAAGSSSDSDDKAYDYKSFTGKYLIKFVDPKYIRALGEAMDLKRAYERFMNGEERIRTIFKNKGGGWMTLDIIKSESFSSTTPYALIGIKDSSERISKSLDDAMSKIAITKTYNLAVVFSSDGTGYHCVHHEKRYLDIEPVGTYRDFLNAISRVTTDDSFERVTSLMALAKTSNDSFSDTIEFVSPRGNIHYCEMTVTTAEAYGEKSTVLLMSNIDNQMTLVTALRESLVITKSADDLRNDFVKQSITAIDEPSKKIAQLSALAIANAENANKVILYLNRIGELSDQIQAATKKTFEEGASLGTDKIFEQENFTLSDFITDLTDRVSYGFSKNGSTFKVKTEGVVHDYLIGDKERLLQMFSTVLLNFSDNIDFGQEVTLDVVEYKDYIILDNYTKLSFSVSATRERAERYTEKLSSGHEIEFEVIKNFAQLNSGDITAVTDKDGVSRVTLEITLKLQKVEHLSGIDMEDRYVLICDDDKEECESVGVMLQSSKVDFMYATTANELAQTFFESRHSGIKFEAAIVNADSPIAAQTVEMLRDFSLNTIELILMITDKADYSWLDTSYKKLYTLKKPVLNNALVQLFEQITSDRIKNGAEEQRSYDARKVLYIDDDRYSRELIEKLFDYLGVSCDIADSGQKATEIFSKSSNYDMIFIDENPGDMSGLELAECLRALSEGKRIPTVMVDANPFRKSDPEAEDGLIDAHIAKPVDIIKIYHTMKKFFRS